MAEKKDEKKGQEAQGGVENSIRTGNQITDKAISAAMKEIESEKDEKKKKEAKKQLCIATFVNRKTLLQLQQRRREDDLTKKKLDKSKSLLERLLGVECEVKDGECVPTNKKVDAKLLLTPIQHAEETRKMEEEFRKAVAESNRQYNDAMDELRDSYEGEYRWYVNDYRY